jgi:GAF domain-containing protein
MSYRGSASEKPASMLEENGAFVDLGLARVLNIMIDTPPLDTFLDEVARLAAEVVTPAAACGLTMRRDGMPFTVSSSDNFAAKIDEIQYGADEGPCLDAMRQGATIQVEDLAGERRWDRYRPHALAHGVASSLSMPLIAAGEVFGAMNLYSPRRAAFSAPIRQHALAFATQCSAALALAVRQADQIAEHAQLAEAMASRSIIDQAIGILMAQQRCTAQCAFDLLRQASQHRNRRLRDIAVDIVTNVGGEPPQPPSPFRQTVRSSGPSAAPGNAGAC